jgi:hypothetical protein
MSCGFGAARRYGILSDLTAMPLRRQNPPRDLGAREELIAEVCEIIARLHHPRPGDSINLQVVCDADLLEAMDEQYKSAPLAAGPLTERIEGSFLTEAGRQAARDILLNTR